MPVLHAFRRLLQLGNCLEWGVKSSVLNESFVFAFSYWPGLHSISLTDQDRFTGGGNCCQAKGWILGWRLTSVVSYLHLPIRYILNVYLFLFTAAQLILIPRRDESVERVGLSFVIEKCVREDGQVNVFDFRSKSYFYGFMQITPARDTFPNIFEYFMIICIYRSKGRSLNNHRLKTTHRKWHWRRKEQCHELWHSKLRPSLLLPVGRL